MQFEHAKRFWKQLFQLTSGAGSNSTAMLNNPGVKFNLDCRAGKYDLIDDSDYAELKAEVAEESALYRNKSSASAETLLIRAVRDTPLDNLELERIVRVLAHASERVCYTDTFFPKGNEQDITAQLSPREIYDLLSEHIHGQDNAKRAVASLAYNHLSGHPSSLLLAGPTGSGKSAMIEALSKIPGIEVRNLDGSRLTVDGYRGSVHLQDIFPEQDDNRHFIAVIDEFDKAAQTHVGSGGTNYTQMLPDQLLLLLEHRDLTFSQGSPEKCYVVDTSRVSIILCGAFENLLKNMDQASGGIGFGAAVRHTHDYGTTTLTTDDFVRYGIRREIMGRITDIAMLRPMSAADFRRILDSPDMSPIDKLSAEYSVQIMVSDALKDELAQDAYASRLGCRYIYSELRRLLNALMFDDCAQSEYHLDTNTPVTEETYSM